MVGPVATPSTSAMTCEEQPRFFDCLVKVTQDPVSQLVELVMVVGISGLLSNHDDWFAKKISPEDLSDRAYRDALRSKKICQKQVASPNIESVARNHGLAVLDAMKPEFGRTVACRTALSIRKLPGRIEGSNIRRQLGGGIPPPVLGLLDRHSGDGTAKENEAAVSACSEITHLSCCLPEGCCSRFTRPRSIAPSPTARHWLQLAKPTHSGVS